MDFSHKPVLFDEVIENLRIRPEGIYVDGTLGGAGHSSAIAGELSESGLLIGVDRDRDAVKAATERLSAFGEKVRIVRGNYSEIPAILKEQGIEKVDGILLDLGVSSYQLDNAERGFSYMQDAALDMRMDRTEGLSA